MVNLIRKYQQPALVFITILVIVTFIWFWNGPAGRAGMAGATKVATLYGRNITDTDIQRDVRKFQIAAALGLDELVQGLAGNAQSQQEALENFVWNSYVFDHEADALQVFPTDSEVQNELARVPGFQTGGVFDPNKLTEFVQEKLPSLGFNDGVIDDLLREQVRVRKVSALIGTAVAVTPSELENRFAEENEQLGISVVRLNTSDVEKSVAVSDADAKKAFAQRPDLYRSDEQRKVEVAAFELSSAQKELKGKERTDALQKLGNESWDFAQAVVEKGSDFNGQAAKFNARLSTTGFFTQARPDPAIENVPALAVNAFHLSTQYPSSDVVEGPNGYYVLHLEGMVPSRPLTFEEARPKIVADVQRDLAAQLMQTKAVDARQRMLAALKAGKSFADAAKSAGLSAEAIPPFSLATISKVDVPDIQAVIQNAIALSPGQLSDFAATRDGGLFVYMNSRQPPSKVAAEIGEAGMKEQFAREQKIGAFFEWLRLRKEAAHLQIAQR